MKNPENSFTHIDRSGYPSIAVMLIVSAADTAPLDPLESPKAIVDASIIRLVNFILVPPIIMLI
jgi:hypothetical protein